MTSRNTHMCEVQSTSDQRECLASSQVRCPLHRLPAGVLFPDRNRRESTLRTAEKCKIPFPKNLDAKMKYRLLFNLALKVEYDRVMARRERAARGKSGGQAKLEQMENRQTSETQKTRLQKDTPKHAQTQECANTRHGATVPAFGQFPSCYMKTLKYKTEDMVPSNQNDAHMLAVALHEEIRHGRKN